MANNDAAFGFQAYRNVDGTAPTINGYAPHGYSIASGYGTALYRGDPVTLSGTADTKGRPGLAIATATGGKLAGVFAGVQYVDVNGDVQFRKNWTASITATEVIAMVHDSPDTLFIVQSDEDVVAADIGQSADFIAGTGNATTGESRYELDSSSIGTGRNMLIHGLADGSEFGNYARVFVTLSENRMFGTTTGGTPVGI